MSRQLDQIKFTYTLRSCANMYDVGFIPITYVREAAIRALGLEPGMRVLDLACGTGLNLPYLARAVGPTGEVVGLDYTRAMLERAKVRVEAGGHQQVRLIEGDAANLDFPEGSFDRVICTHALSIIPRSREALRRAVLTLKPGGRMAVADLKRMDAPLEALQPFYDVVVNPVYEAMAFSVGCAHPSREIIREMKLLLANVKMDEFVGGAIYVASGTKTSATGAREREDGHLAAS
jgi:demethylmenaquinone methyltransferase/2-methoxy-6-polyprenyl-1,4-benzoquinol methylase